jgi:hypothetical protein
MDRGNRSPRREDNEMISGDSPGKPLIRPGFALLRLETSVPVELKFLINFYKSRNRMPSFSWAVRALLETHPDLAKLAAELYTDRQTDQGTERPSIGETP